MRKLVFLIFLFVFILRFEGVYSQEIRDYYSTLSEEKWFPRQSIRSIFQDSKGYLWIATNAGLFSYNNYLLKNIDISKKLQTNFLSITINSLSEDLNGNLLVATESGLGLINFKKNKKLFLSKSYETIPKVLTDHDGKIWFYNTRKDLFQLDPQHYQSQKLQPFLNFRKASGFKNIQIRQMYLSSQGKIFLATNVGLFTVDKEHKSLILCFKDYEVLKVLETSDQRLLIVRNGDLLLLRKKVLTNRYELDQTLIKGERIRLLTGEPNGVIVASSVNKVFACLTGGVKIEFHSLVEDFIRLYNISITGLAIDRNHNIWIGTQKGLFKINRQNIKTRFYDQFSLQTQAGNMVNDLFYYNSKLWVCSSKEGLFTLNLKADQLDKIPIPITNANFIKNTSDGHLKLLANHQLFEFNANNPKQYSSVKLPHLPNQITDMLEIMPGEWWFVSWTSGIYRYVDPSIKSIDHLFFKEIADSLKSSNLFGMIKTRQNQIWVVTRGQGAFKIDLKNKQLYHYQEHGIYHSIPSNRLMCIFEDSQSQLWIGTRGNGLLRYNPTADDFSAFTIQDGLPSNTICDIIESSNGNLWVSTLDGIAKYQPRQILPFYPYGIEDGIFNPEFSFSVGSAGPDNALFFGASDGFYKINYVKKSGYSKPIPVVWTNFKILNQDNQQDSTAFSQLLSRINEGKKITLTSYQGSFSIGFAALDFTAPSKTQYAYRLLGYDHQWHFITGESSSAQYLNVPSGDYNFEVRATNERGEWTTKPKSLQVTILPSFWVTKTAILIYILTLFTLITIAWLLLKRWYKLKEDLNSEHAVSEMQQQQMVQFADLSHEIKNRLTLILGPLENALKGKRVNQTILNNLYEQTQRLKRLSDQIIKIRKSESGFYVLNVSEEPIRQHLSQIFYEMKPLALVKNVMLNIHLPNEECYAWYDKELLEIIVLNVLGNAIKYSKVNGRVDMNITELTDKESEIKWLMIKIIDDGIGIPKEDISRIMDLFYRAPNAKSLGSEASGDGIGLNLVSRLIKIHHGRLLIQSEPNVKTEFEIKIPISKNEYSISELKMSVKNTQIILNETDINQNAIIQPVDKLEEFNLQDKSILVIDDEIEILNLLTAGLKDTFNVHGVTNGKLALDLLISQSFDLIISDLSMPNMDGLTLCTNIRNHPKLNHLPFILLTARNSEEQKLIAFKAQVDDFIEKPFSVELIKWRVKALLRQRKSLAQNIQKVVVPEQAIDVSDSPDEQFIQKVVNIIDANVSNEFLNVDFIADEMSMSRATLYRRMETLFGESPSQYIKKFRLKKAVSYLKSEKYTISEIAFKAGFKTANYFSKCFHKEFGKSPTEFMGGL
ncbi:response regulator [Pedobacter sp. SD-b]|uniref:histidine kinase n=1 Tax=Pedobacter segetis TaxID=2793069 RepID=A0ABS1BJ02_9SPHI|nr:hybrid sensor histidine kinase/response regulator transcription factor [Pedobacter segetis]MBK0382855.1 response regulator [Pedobacter segetis]